jgi:hypothetical protein
MQQLEQARLSLTDKDTKLDQSAKKNKDFESKLQKLMADFTGVRSKAQEMLVQKDNEIKRLKDKTVGGRKGEQSFTQSPRNNKNLNNSGIDSGDEALS